MTRIISVRPVSGAGEMVPGLGWEMVRARFSVWKVEYCGGRGSHRDGSFLIGLQSPLPMFLGSASALCLGFFEGSRYDNDFILLCELF